FFLWLFLTAITEKYLNKNLPDRDPYIFTIAALLSGWGLLSIWRLTPLFGIRQTIWLAVSMGALMIGTKWDKLLPTLRRYKYILLISGLILTSLTLIFGANPLGIGPRLWLGFGGVYLQPSEPLKLLLVIYLSAYLANKPIQDQQIFPFILPTLFLASIALLLLLVQRDLGAASIFIMLYASILYLAIARKRVLFINASILLAVALFGYFFIDIIHTRLSIWISPWGDPSGRGYQIIQSLMAIANGGLWGRGIGIGSPAFVPVAHSDFIFTSLAEETGLAGTLGLFALLGIFLSRGLRIALRAPSRYLRLLAAGLTMYLGIQSLLIIGGNLRLLPLTGVTLPFISYGGSSLLTSFIALLLLLKISNENEEAAPLPKPQPYHLLSALLMLGLVLSAIINGWWAILRGPDLLTRSDNPRRTLADLYVPRGNILDRNNKPIVITKGTSGELSREYLYPNLSPVTGYTNSIYGQAGIEFALDEYLRGLAGNPTSTIWWNQLLYGQPPSGLDLRLSIDIDLQEDVDQRLSKHKGAVVLINAQSGEILVMSSHPTFDANQLDETVLNDENSPLINRATQGQYPISITETSLFFKTSEIRTIIRIPVEDGSPIEMAIAASALSNAGLAPAPRLALAVNTPQSEWVILPALGEETQLFTQSETDSFLKNFTTDNGAYWHFLVADEKENITWLLAGTTKNWQGAPLGLVILLEENNAGLAEEIAKSLLSN
ncbi:MAG: FtsW/RodA/SpoVE family cell cycle protein, partial [Anaerolineae bacterium]|nr:FtsW/RodA/SpoVE family cell cycle protein [Anaerolineae bacterium]